MSVRRLFQLNSPEWMWLLLGFIGCGLTGSIMPVFAFFYGEVFAVSIRRFFFLITFKPIKNKICPFFLQTFTLRGEALEKAALFWTYMFLVLAVVSGFSFWLQVRF